MKINGKRLLINHVFANLESASQPRVGNDGDTAFAGDDAYEKPEKAQTLGAETLGHISAYQTPGLIWEDAYETDELRDLGGEG